VEVSEIAFSLNLASMPDRLLFIIHYSLLIEMSTPLAPSKGGQLLHFILSFINELLVEL